MRKEAWALTLALALLFCAARAEGDAYVVSTNENMPMVIGHDGELIYPDGRFSSIYDLQMQSEGGGRQLFAVADGSSTISDEYGFIQPLYALADADGNVLTDMLYSFRWACPQSNSVLFSRDGLLGAMDENGNELFCGDYSQLEGVGSGFLAIRGGKLFAINRSGNERELGIECDGFFVSGDRACVTDANGVSHILDEDGAEVAVLPEGRSAGYSAGEYLVVYEKGHAFESAVGLVDRNGNEVLPMVYSSIAVYDGTPGAPVIARTAGGAALFDRDTLENVGFIPMDEDSWISAQGGGVLMVYRYGYYDVYDWHGAYIDTLEKDAYLYSNATFSDGDEKVFILLTRDEALNSVCYLVDERLNPVGSAEYREISFAGWQDGHGRYVATNYDTVPIDDSYQAYVSGSQRSALLDETGSVLLDMEYESLIALEYDRYWVKRADVWGLIDSAGHWYYRQSAYTNLMD